MNTQTNSKRGFTIIEVVLVLAIAGLIFLIVFLAVPALQRSQRDQQRKNDMGRLIGAVQDYRSNHQGALPTFNAAFATQVAQGSSFEDPSGGTYAFPATQGGNPTNATNGNIAWQIGSTCDSSGAFVTGAGNRKVAFRMQLESGDTYCQSN
jgi:prepilin-type N-terminal cleavage/methylation domain-containing protein